MTSHPEGCEQHDRPVSLTLDGPAEHFLESYRSAGREEFTAPYPFYRALECLHRARRDLCKRVPPVREWAETMLDEGLRAL